MTFQPIFHCIIPENKLDICALTSNTNAAAIKIVEKNLEKLNKWGWLQLSSNINAIPILENNEEKVDWSHLSSNPNAIPILEKHLDKVNWQSLSDNTNAISILEKHLDKVDWDILHENSNIFKLNTQMMRNRCMKFAEELAAYVFYPERVFRMANQFNLEFDKYLFLV